MPLCQTHEDLTCPRLARNLTPASVTINPRWPLRAHSAVYIVVINFKVSKQERVAETHEGTYKGEIHISQSCTCMRLSENVPSSK